MKQKTKYDDIISRTFKILIASTCAEATLQGLQEIWKIQNKDYSWATSGYLGAIISGQTTCGLLIGSSVAIGLKVGQTKECLPLEDSKARDRAVEEVAKLYEDFQREFGSTECRALIGCDFSKVEDQKRYYETEVYKAKCYKFFEYVMSRFVKLEKYEK